MEVVVKGGRGVAEVMTVMSVVEVEVVALAEVDVWVDVSWRWRRMPTCLPQLGQGLVDELWGSPELLAEFIPLLAQELQFCLETPRAEEATAH